MEQKDEFSRYMETAKRLAASLPASTEKSRAFAWLKYLHKSGNSNLRMDYMKLLVFSLQKNQLLGIFADDPPVGMQIPPFPGGVSLATMKDYLTSLAAVDQGSGDTNLRAANRTKNGMPLNNIPEETEILCYMLHGGNEVESSPRKSCNCSSNNRSAASGGRQSGQQGTPPRPNPLEFPWLREVPGQEAYDLGYQDPWLNFHYLQLRKKPKEKKKNLFTQEEEQNISFPSFDTTVSGAGSVGIPDEMWQPAEVVFEELWEDQFPSDPSDQFRISSPQAKRSQSPQRFQQSPQQVPRMSPPRRSSHSPRIPAQMPSPQTPLSSHFSQQGSPGFSPQHMSTPVRSPQRPAHQDWSYLTEDYFNAHEFPVLYQPGRPKSRWAYTNTDNAAVLAAYQTPPALSQTHPVRQSPRREMRDPAMQTMYDYRNPVMRDPDYYSQGPADLYDHAYNVILRGDLSSTVEEQSLQYDDEGLLLPQNQGAVPSAPRTMPLSASYTTPRRPVRVSPPRQLNVSAPGNYAPTSPRRQGMYAGAVPPPSPEQRFWGPPQRPPSPVMGRRSPSPAGRRGWEDSSGYYSGSAPDPRSFVGCKSPGCPSFQPSPAGSPSYQPGPAGNQSFQPSPAGNQSFQPSPAGNQSFQPNVEYKSSAGSPSYQASAEYKSPAGSPSYQASVEYKSPAGSPSYQASAEYKSPAGSPQFQPSVAGSPSFQASMEGSQRRRRPLFVHHCNCSCANTSGQQPQAPQQAPNLPTGQSPTSFYVDLPGAACDDGNPPNKQEPDDIGKARLPQLETSSPDSAHSGWEQAEDSPNSVPQEISGGDLSIHQKSACGCPSKGEHYR